MKENVNFESSVLENINFQCALQHGLAPISAHLLAPVLGLTNDSSTAELTKKLEKFWSNLKYSDIADGMMNDVWFQGRGGPFHGRFCFPKKKATNFLMTSCDQEATSQSYNNAKFADDIWLKILAYLPSLPDLFRCIRVCRRWKRLIELYSLPYQRVFSRRVILPSMGDGSNPWSLESVDNVLLCCQPFIPKTMMRVLFAKMAPYLREVVLDGLRNHCSECRLCDFKYELFFGKDGSHHVELYLERYCTADLPPTLRLDSRFIQLFANTPNLKYLNLYGVSVKDELLLKLAELVGDSLQMLIFGSDVHSTNSISACVEGFLAKFTSLTFLGLPPSGPNYCSPTLLIKCLPSTICSMDLQMCPLPVDHVLGALPSICPLLSALSLNVVERISMRQLNKICRNLTSLDLLVLEEENCDGYYKFGTRLIIEDTELEFCASKLVCFQLRSERKDLSPDSITSLQTCMETMLSGVSKHSRALCHLKIHLARDVRKSGMWSTTFDYAKLLNNLPDLLSLSLHNLAIKNEDFARAFGNKSIQELGLLGCETVTTSWIQDCLLTYSKTLRCIRLGSMPLCLDVVKSIMEVLDATRPRDSLPRCAEDPRILLLDQGDLPDINLHPWLVRIASPWRLAYRMYGCPSLQRLKYETLGWKVLEREKFFN